MPNRDFTNLIVFKADNSDVVHAIYDTTTGLSHLRDMVRETNVSLQANLTQMLKSIGMVKSSLSGLGGAETGFGAKPSTRGSVAPDPDDYLSYMKQLLDPTMGGQAAWTSSRQLNPEALGQAGYTSSQSGFRNRQTGAFAKVTEQDYERMRLDWENQQTMRQYGNQGVPSQQTRADLLKQRIGEAGQETYQGPLGQAPKFKSSEAMKSAVDAAESGGVQDQYIDAVMGRQAKWDAALQSRISGQSIKTFERGEKADVVGTQQDANWAMRQARSYEAEKQSLLKLSDVEQRRLLQESIVAKRTTLTGEQSDRDWSLRETQAYERDKVEALRGADISQRALLENAVAKKKAAIQQDLGLEKDANDRQKPLLEEAIRAKKEQLQQAGYQQALQGAPASLQQRMKTDMLKSMSTKEIYEASAQGVITNAEAQERLNAKIAGANNGISHQVKSIAVGMAVWQGMNIAVNAVMGTISGAITEIGRLDETAAKLSVTLGIGKTEALQYAQALAMQGVAYGMTPEESLGLATYASRVNKAPAKREELTTTASKLGTVTGEDPKKLIDDLNVTYRQTGISVEKLGDMAARAWQNSGTSASEYLNILREIGPLANESGIDIERMAGIAAVSADRMGGSMSDAANTLTRLIKAVQSPNAMQSDVLTKYGIKAGGNVQTMMNQVSAANMSAEDMAALGGRPGQPAVANDIRTLLAVYKEYNGELQKGMGLNEAYAKSIDSAVFATKQLDAAWKELLSTLSETDTVQTSIRSITKEIVGLSGAIKAGDWGILLALLSPTTSATAWQALGAAGAGKMVETPTQTPTNYAGSRVYAAEGTTTTTTAAPAPATARPAYDPMLQLYNKVISGQSMPTSTTDISKYTGTQIKIAQQDSEQMAKDWLKTISDVYDSLGIEGGKKQEAMDKARAMIDETITFFEENGQIVALSGAPAKYMTESLQKQESLRSGLTTNVTDLSRYSDDDIKRGMSMVPKYMQNLEQMWRQSLTAKGATKQETDQTIAAQMEYMNKYQAQFARGNTMTMMQGAGAMLLPQILPQLTRTQALEDRLTELKRSLEDLNDTEKKKAQLEGGWNIPSGAKILVPLTPESQQLIKEHGGESEDESKNRRRAQIEKEIAETESKLAEEQAKDAALLASFSNLPTKADETGVSLNGMKGKVEGTTGALGGFEAKLKSFADQMGYKPADWMGKESKVPGAEAGKVSKVPGQEYKGFVADPALQRAIDMMTTYQPQQFSSQSHIRPSDVSKAPAFGQEGSQVPGAAPIGSNFRLENTITIQPITVNVMMDREVLVRTILPDIQKRMADDIRNNAMGTSIMTQ